MHEKNVWVVWVFLVVKTKYGEDDDDESSSDEDDDETIQLDDELEKEFFRTLSTLKKKDPIIYNSETSFFKNVTIEPKKIQGKKEQPLFINDYERKLILEKQGVLSDEEDEDKMHMYILFFFCFRCHYFLVFACVSTGRFL